MAEFIGKYAAKVDDKGRVVFPSSFKALLSSDDMRLVVKKDIFEDCLEMYTYSEWVNQAEAVRNKLNFFNKAHAMFWREYMRDCAVVEPDGKLGRISIPKQLLEAIGIEKEVCFFGVNHKIEIWAADKFEAARISNEEYVSLAGMLSEL